MSAQEAPFASDELCGREIKMVLNKSNLGALVSNVCTSIAGKENIVGH